MKVCVKIFFFNTDFEHIFKIMERILTNKYKIKTAGEN